MSLFKAALAGAAQAGDQILTKYIDEDLAAKRAQMMADLQRKNADLIRRDDAAFGDERAPIVRQQRVDDETAIGGARNKTALQGEINRAQSPELLDAEVKRADAAAAAALRAKKNEISDTELTAATVAREKAILTGTMNEKAKAAGLMARATDLNGGERAARTALVNMELSDKRRLGQLYDDYLKITNSNLPEAEKAKQLAPISNAITTLKAKNGVGGAGKQDYGYQETETETDPLTGKEITKTKTRTPLGPGGAPAAAVDRYAINPGAAPAGKDPYAKSSDQANKLPQRREAPPPYMPPADSPAGKRRALMEQAREAASAQNESESALGAVRRANAEDKARTVLATGDKRAMYQFQQSEDFKYLDGATKARISAAVLGR